MTEKTFLLQLRDQAKEEPNDDLRVELWVTADFVETALGVLYRYPTTSNMVTLNGIWARAQRLLIRSEEGVGPEGGGGGAMRVEDSEREAA